MTASATEGTLVVEPAKFSSYALNKCLISFGLINGIVNAIIFALMHLGAFDTQFDAAGIVGDLAVTGVILGAILFACAVPLTKHDARAEKFDYQGFSGIARLIPRSYVAALLLVAVVAGVLMAALGALAAFVLPSPLPCVGMMVLKGCVCAIGGAAAGYLSVTFAARAYPGE